MFARGNFYIQPYSFLMSVTVCPTHQLTLIVHRSGFKNVGSGFVCRVLFRELSRVSGDLFVAYRIDIDQKPRSGDLFV